MSNSSIFIKKPSAFLEMTKSLVKQRKNLDVEEIIIEETNLDNVIELTKKRTKERTLKDIQVISTFLDGTEFIKKFKMGKTLNEYGLSKLLTFCSINVQYEYIEKDKFLFRQGDYGDKFYIIIKGSVGILRIAHEKAFINALQYYRFLMELKKDNHTNLLQRNIRENSHIFYFDYNYIDLLEELLFIVELTFLVQTENNTALETKDYEDFFLRYNRNPIDYNLNFAEKKVFSFDFIMEKIKRFSPAKLLINKYHFENIDLESKNITILKFEKIISLGPNQYFGDFALDNQSNVRTASIQAENNTVLGFITTKIYNEYLFHEKQKIHSKEINFLLSFSFLKNITDHNFDRKYFSFFMLQDYYKGNTIYSENDDIQNIFLIKEGEIELSIKKNFSELNSIINSMIKKYNSIFKKCRIEQNMPTALDINWARKDRKTFKIMIVGKMQILGLNEFLFKENMFFNCKVISDKAIMYNIKLDSLERLVESEEEIKNSISATVQNSMSMLLSRLIDMRSMELDFIEGNKQLSNREVLQTRLKKEKNLLLMNKPSPIIKFQSHINLKQNIINGIVMKESSVNQQTRYKSNQSKNSIGTFNLQRLEDSKKINLTSRKNVVSVFDKFNDSDESNELINNRTEHTFDLLPKSPDIEIIKYRKMKKNLESLRMSTPKYSRNNLFNIIQTNQSNSSVLHSLENILMTHQKSLISIEDSVEKSGTKYDEDKGKRRIKPIYIKMNQFKKKKEIIFPRINRSPEKNVQLKTLFDNDTKERSFPTFKHLFKLRKVNK